MPHDPRLPKGPKTPKKKARAGRPHIIKPHHIAIAKEVIRDGVPLKRAMMAHGYSKSTSSGGYSNLKGRFPSLWDALQEEMTAWVASNKKKRYSAQERAALAEQRLLMNTISGEDGGTASAKLLWQDREVNRLSPDTAVGIFNMPVPHELKQFYTLPEAVRLNDTKPSLLDRADELLTTIDRGLESTEDTGTPDVPENTETDV